MRNPFAKSVALFALCSVIIISVATYVQRRYEPAAATVPGSASTAEGSDEGFLSSTFHVRDAEEYLKEEYQQKFNTFAPGHPEATTHMFSDSFTQNYRINEAPQLSQSESQSWWVSSGGVLVSEAGRGRTVQGALPAGDRVREEYAKSNPRDTDQGTHPQNIFRLVQMGTWQNYTQEVYFRITALNQSDSPNRNESNGLLLFNRYQTGDNLYYAGVRVDGDAVIKKKIHGTYYTLAQTKVFPGGKYDRDTNFNLLPLNAWIGIRTVVTQNPDNSVGLKLYMDKGWTSHWTLLLEATDHGTEFGGPAITGAGYAGIRTDFMDVEFNEYKIEELP